MFIPIIRVVSRESFPTLLRKLLPQELLSLAVPNVDLCLTINMDVCPARPRFNELFGHLTKHAYSQLRYANYPISVASPAISALLRGKSCKKRRGAAEARSQLRSALSARHLLQSAPFTAQRKNGKSANAMSANAIGATTRQLTRGV